MTENPRHRLPSPSATLATGLALFLVLLAFLAWQMRSGHDPALRAQHPASALTAAVPQRVLVKRIHRKVIEEKVLLIPSDDERSHAVARAVVVAAPAGASTSGPVYSAPAPAASAPAPAPAAPAPAPAPAVTHTS